jgi:hygromycin-B 7''-O-kinase
VPGPPPLPTLRDLRSRLGDVRLWTPYVDEVLARHDLLDGRHDVVAGSNPTYPTFVRGDVVVKLFGCDALPWREAYAAERAGLELAGTDPGLRAPHLLAAGLLRPEVPAGTGASWPYLVMGRVAGLPVWAADLDRRRRESLAADLGDWLRRLQALQPATGIPADDAWSALDVPAAAAHSSLPDHLVRQVAPFLAAHPLRGHVVVHGDVIENHVHVDGDGHVVAVIDWGDVAVTDPHYELAQIHRDLFDCDVGLLRTLLDAASWPVGTDFAPRGLAAALWRQAVGWDQHGSMDVFEPAARRLPLATVATLDELAVALYGG